MIKRIQNKIAESRFLLPVMAVYATLTWLLVGLITDALWVQFICFAFSTYLMAELNNSNTLIRIYSRMVSSSFLMLSCTMPLLFKDMGSSVVGVCCIASLSTLFKSYQDKQAPGWVFYSFFCIGIASFWFIQILFYVPILWIVMIFNIQSFSWRTFGASLLGLIAPYWFAFVYHFMQGTHQQLISNISSITTIQDISPYPPLPTPQAITFLFIVMIAAIGMIHYIHTSYNDKIKVRMLYNCFIILNICTTLFICLQPQYYDMLIRLQIITSAPLIGHYIALTHSRLSNIIFWVITSMALILTIYNLWIPSLIY